MARFMREGEAFLRPIGDVRIGDRERGEGRIWEERKGGKETRRP